MFPSFSELFNEFVAKFKQARPGVDPTVKGSWSFAFGRGVSAIGYSLVILGKELLKQFNPLTATGLFLELWASYDSIARLGASPSIGTINVFGVNGTVIPGSTFWAGQINGLLYTNTSPATIQVQDIDQVPVTILVLTQVGNVATAECSFPHSLLTGTFVTIAGADQLDYNGNFAITADPDDVFKFTYTITGGPVTPATGSPYSAIPIRKVVTITEDSGTATATTEFSHGFVDQQYVSITDVLPIIYNDLFLITVTGDKTFTFVITPSTGDASSTPAGLVRSVHAAVNVQSQDNGPETIVTSDGLLDMQDPVPVGADITGKTAEGLQGGAVVESDDSLRARMLLSRSSTKGVFTNDEIELAAKLINGNTDVFIKNPNTVTLAVSDPNAIFPGQVKVYILRKNDPVTPIPTGGILETTKLSIIENAGLPADVWIEDIFVLAPLLTPIDITMTNVLPDTATMKQAIRSQFEAYFSDEAELGEDIDNDILRGVAIETQDLNSGIPKESFITRFNWTDIQVVYAISNVIDNSGVPRFVFTSGPTLGINDLITHSGFSGTPVAITSVSDNASIAEFNFTPGPTFAIGMTVVISGFTANPSYNGTFVVTTMGVGSFRVGSILFGSDETGSFIPTYNGDFRVSFVDTGVYEVETLSATPLQFDTESGNTGNLVLDSELISGDQLPELGTLTVNGQVVS